MNSKTVGLTVREFMMLSANLAAWRTISGAAILTPDTEGLGMLDPAEIQIGKSRIDISFGPGAIDLPRESILRWISTAAHAVAHYYGAFPVPITRVRVIPSDDRSGPFSGETWGSDPPFTRIYLGRNTDQRQLDTDWLMTHEFVHTAFPDVARQHHWIEEGIATYVEPIARVQTGSLAPEDAWAGMLTGMPKGEPGPSDKGLDHTPTWGRTYWGGAIFCLVAEVRIRQHTNNGKGLQNALRGIRDAGENIEHHWPLTAALQAGDEVTQTNVLTALYSEMKDKPVYVDLPMLWRELGVASFEGAISFNDSAPLAHIRKAMTSSKV